MPDGAAPPAPPATSPSALWAHLGGDARLLAHLGLRFPAPVLPSVYDVTGFAAASVGVATLAVAELAARRHDRPVGEVAVDRVGAAAAFCSEALLQPVGWERPATWDPIAGDYRTADGWVRLHTNYAAHRAAALAALGVPGDRDAVAAAAARAPAEELEGAVVAAGGCAAAMWTREQWAGHPHGQATAGEPPVAWVAAGPRAGALPPSPPDGGALGGLRVLDLTRVIAGPVCTRFLAAHGAEVLRLDPPGFEEVAALLPDVTVGKRCATLDLAGPAGLERFAGLVAQAHVLVHGLRPGALEGRGVTEAWLRERNPGLVVAALDAYGWVGPWRGRRGFDSLVQMSTGIAAAGMAARGLDRPGPLPAQALDHGTGYLLAAAACRALSCRVGGGPGADVRASLLGAANALVAGPPGEPDGEHPEWPDEVFEAVDSGFGPARRVRCPGTIDGVAPTWSLPAGPLHVAEPRFTTG